MAATESKGGDQGALDGFITLVQTNKGAACTMVIQQVRSAHTKPLLLHHPSSMVYGMLLMVCSCHVIGVKIASDLPIW